MAFNAASKAHESKLLTVTPANHSGFRLAVFDQYQSVTDDLAWPGYTFATAEARSPSAARYRRNMPAWLWLGTLHCKASFREFRVHPGFIAETIARRCERSELATVLGEELASVVVPERLRVAGD